MPVHLLTRTLLERELEERKVEKENGDELVFAVPSSRVVGTIPAQSVDSTFVGSCANVFSVTDISWHEARWNWYRAQAHSSVPDLSKFQAPVVSASSGALASASMPSALVSQPVQSRFVPGGFHPKMFCRHLFNGVCVGTRARLHTPLAERQFEVEDYDTASDDFG